MANETTRILRVTSDTISAPCEMCGHVLEGFTSDVKHYLQERNQKLLHIGTESHDAYTPNLNHITVAILGDC